MYTEKQSGTSVFVYEKLKDQILHLELPPGQAISEIDTAAKYQISRTPVRDAFKMLAREGLLEIRPHIGTFVSLIDLKTVSDILYIREILEQAVYKELSMRHDKSREFHIRLILEEQRKLLDAPLSEDELARAFILSDNTFHRALYEMAGKDTVIDFISSIHSQYERFRTFLNFSDRAYLLRLCDDHQAIWESIAMQDYEQLADRISHHIYDGFNSSTESVHRHPEYFISARQ